MASSKARTPEIFVRQATGLVRQIGTFDAIAMNIILEYLPIGALGLLVLPFSAPGSNLVGATSIAALASFSLAIVYWLLNVGMPRSGGDYVYNTRILTPSIGFAANFSFTMWVIFEISLNSVAVASTGVAGFLNTLGTIYNNPSLLSTASYFGTSNGEFVFATVVNIFAAVLVISGLRKVLAFHRVTFVIAFIGTVLGILVIAVATNSQFVTALAKYGVDYNSVIQSANTSGLFPTVSNWNQLAPTLFGIGFASTALIFFQFTAYVGGEIKNTKRSAPIALIGSLAVLTVLMILVAYGLSNVIGSQFLGSIYGMFYGGSKSYPLSIPPSYVLFESVLVGNNQFLVYLMGLGWIIWSIAIIPLMYLTMSRVVMAWGYDRVLPSFFSDVNEKTGSPIKSIIFIFVVSQLFLFPLAFLPVFTTIFSSGLIGFVIDYFVVAIAAILFPVIKKDLFNRIGLAKYKIGSLPLISFAGTIAAIFMGLLMYGLLTNPGFAIYNPSNPATTLIDYGIAFSVFIAGFVIFYVSQYARKREGMDLKLAFAQIPPE